MRIFITPLRLPDSLQYITSAVDSLGQVVSTRATDSVELIAVGQRQQLSLEILGPWRAEESFELIRVAQSIKFNGCDRMTIESVLAVAEKATELSFESCQIPPTWHSDRRYTTIGFADCIETRSVLGLTASVVRVKLPLIEQLSREILADCQYVFAFGGHSCSPANGLASSKVATSGLRWLADGRRRLGLHLSRLEISWESLVDVLSLGFQSISIEESDITDGGSWPNRGNQNHNVRNLDLGVLGLESKHVAYVLRLLPRLESVKLMYSNGYSDVMAALAELQHLQHIDIGSAGSVSVRGHRIPQVRSVICSRLRHRRKEIERAFPQADVLQV